MMRTRKGESNRFTDFYNLIQLHKGGSFVPRTREIGYGSRLKKALQSEPQGTLLIVGSGYFLRLCPGSSRYEVWLTTRRKHFEIAVDALSRQARAIIESALPRFSNALQSNGCLAAEWDVDVSHDVPRITHAGETLHPVHSFSIPGNRLTIAGPYVFERSDWSCGAMPLKELPSSLIPVLLERSVYTYNTRPYVNPETFSQFVVACNCIAHPSELRRLPTGDLCVVEF